MSTLTITNTLTDGTAAYGSQVNTNFVNVSTWANNTDAGTNVWTVVNGAAFQLNGADIFKMVRYRRPVLQYVSGTVIGSETGLDGTSTDGVILFPDGTVRVETSTTLNRADMTVVAVLTGTKKGGLQTGTVANNTWYNLYAAKATDTSTDWVLVADVTVPSQANFSTLNTSYGTNGWVYLGTIPAGTGVGATSTVPKFLMVGEEIAFQNAQAGGVGTYDGVQLAVNASASSLTYTYAAGTNLAVGQTPGQLNIGTLTTAATASTKIDVQDAAGAANIVFVNNLTSGQQIIRVADYPLNAGLKLVASGATAVEIFLNAYKDLTLAGCMNPIL